MSLACVGGDCGLGGWRDEVRECEGAGERNWPVDGDLACGDDKGGEDGLWAERRHSSFGGGGGGSGDAGRKKELGLKGRGGSGEESLGKLGTEAGILVAMGAKVWVADGVREWVVVDGALMGASCDHELLPG